MDSVPKQPESNRLTLTRKQKEAIPHLIGARSLEEGRRKARVSKSALFGWLRDETFRAELERTREEVITQALDRLKASITQGVDGLVELMSAEERHIQLKACLAIIEFTLRTKEIHELSDRLAKVEKLVFERRTYK